MKLLHLIYICSLLLLASCGGGSGGGGETKSNSDNDGGTASSGLPSDINGLIVLNTWNGSRNEGIYALELDKGQVTSNKHLTTAAKGINPYAYDRNTITYAEPCSGQFRHHRTKIINTKGLSSAPITKCTSEFIVGFGLYDVAKLSPDKSKLVVEIEKTGSNVWTHKHIISVIDMDTGAEIQRYDDYTSPDWHPDGRLLLSTPDYNDSKGIFITDKNFTELSRIDQGLINQSVSSLSVSPLGNKLIFSMSGRIWIMDINSGGTLGNLEETISEGGTVESPIWSPDGKYIAYLSFRADKALKKITFWNTTSKTPYVFSTTKIFPVNSHGIHWMTPLGPLSWVK